MSTISSTSNNTTNTIEETLNQTVTSITTIEELKNHRFSKSVEEINDKAKEYVKDNYLDVSLYPELKELHQGELPDNSVKFKLFFTEECKYMKSTMWNTRVNKNLTITNNKLEADFIITPSWTIQGKDGVKMSYVDGSLHLTNTKNKSMTYSDLSYFSKEEQDSLINFINIEKQKNIKYNPLIIQETDLHQIIYKYLSLNIIDDELINTVKTIFTSTNRDLKLVKNIIETSDWVKSPLDKQKELLELIHLHLNYDKGDSQKLLYRIKSHPIRKVVCLIYNSIVTTGAVISIYNDRPDSNFTHNDVFLSMFSLNYINNLYYCITHKKQAVPSSLLTNEKVLQPELDYIINRIKELELDMSVEEAVVVVTNADQLQLNV